MEKLNALVRKIYVSSKASAEEAIKIMVDNDVSGLAVVDDGFLVGVLSARDILKPLICSQYHNSELGSVSQFMVLMPRIIENDVGLNDIIDIFTDKPLHYYPVVNKTQKGVLQYLGTVYRSDLLKHVSGLEKTTW